MPTLQTPQGYPVWQTEELPDDWGEIVEEEAYRKPWKNCSYCEMSPEDLDQTRFSRCEYCAFVRSGDPARYCSRKCQRRHWKDHREECEDLNKDDEMLKEMSAREVPFLQMANRQARRWKKAYGPVFNWAIRQAYMRNGIENTADVGLNIDLHWMNPRDPQSAPWPESFEFVPLNPKYKWTVPEGSKDHLVGRYCITFRLAIGERGWLYLDTDPDYDEEGVWVQVDDYGYEVKRDDSNKDAKTDKLLKERKEKRAQKDTPTKRAAKIRASTRPQWPWILAHCLLMGDINPEMAKVRLLTLLCTIDKFGDEPLRAFSAPAFTSFKLKLQSLDKWMRVMFPVVGFIASHFRDPSNIVRRTYATSIIDCRARAGEDEEVERKE